MLVNLSALGYDIRERRITKGISQAKVARLCGISITTLQRWENGTTKTVEEQSLVKLKKVLDDVE